MIDNSEIFGDIEVFQNLFEKRSLLMTPFFIFDEVINKVVFGQQIMHQSLDPVNYLTDRHHFTVDIADPGFNCMSCLELEILGGEAYMFLLY